MGIRAVPLAASDEAADDECFDAAATIVPKPTRTSQMEPPTLRPAIVDDEFELMSVPPATPLQPTTEEEEAVTPELLSKEQTTLNAWRAKTIVACAMYMACSSLMMLCNKQVVMRLQTPVTILDLQLLFTVLVLSSIFPWTLRFGTLVDVWRWSRVVPLLFAAMLATSMIAQQYASMGLQVAIRNLGPLVTLPVERAFNEPIVADASTWGALGLILVGVVLYVSESLKQQGLVELAIGIALCTLNLLFAMFERLYQRRMIALQPVDISKTGMLLLNNFGAVLPVTILFCVPGLNQEPVEWRERWSSAGFFDYILLLLSGVCGIAIGWTGINVQQYVTATTFLMITNLNKIVVVSMGMVFLGDSHGPVAVLGIVLALGGGVWYTLARNAIGKRQSITTRTMSTVFAPAARP